ncbi:MAG: YtxH domain-containing protein [Flavobacteriales bacterium]
MSAKSTIAIALTALAAGAAIGLLLAPASGADTRKKLMKKGSALRDRLADMVEEGSELIDKLKGDAEDLADKAKSTANAAKERVKDAASDMASQARSTANAGGYSKS